MKSVNADPKIILQGGGEHARVVLDCLLEHQSNVVAIFDPRQTGSLFDVAQLGVYQPDFEPDALCVVAIGDNAIRRKVVLETRHEFIRVIHNSAIVSPRSEVGQGSMVLHRSVIQARSAIGEHVIINTGAQVDHDCHVGSFSHVAPGAILCGTVTLGEGAFIGAGAVIIPGIKIGRWSVIGAGTVVRNDVPDFTLVAGNPGRIIRKISQ